MSRLLAAMLLMGLDGSAFAQNAPGHMHDYGFGWGHGWGMGWGGGMLLGPILTLGLVILLVALLVPLVRGLGGGAPRGPNARDILDQRYAKGEIDREEYLRRRQDIAGD